ncbi:MAG: hypothetical protein BGO29_08635 [Bacteroidales bacterium 36-12]|nr:MAG: hypothetical protein BGO29_08635 [Bacteroidales bacterium 36-12]
MFDKSSSFDRLFPNQDSLSGKGFGNLIALPLFKPTLEKGNSCFINPETFEPIADQWAFLNEIKRISVNELDNLYQQFSNSTELISQKISSRKMEIALSNQVKISRSSLTTPLINFLKEELNFYNSEFIIKMKSGRNTFGTERYFNPTSTSKSFFGFFLL